MGEPLKKQVRGYMKCILGTSSFNLTVAPKGKFIVKRLAFNSHVWDAR